MVNDNLVHPFEDEFAGEGERYIEKYQEELFKQSEPSPELLESLKTQDHKTLRRLRNVLLEVLENNTDTPEKYQRSIDAINEILESSAN